MQTEEIFDQYLKYEKVQVNKAPPTCCGPPCYLECCNNCQIMEILMMPLG
jgi:hypothetical protein